MSDRTIVLVVAALCASLQGCADNAILEAELTLPPGISRFAVVDVASAPDGRWPFGTADTEFLVTRSFDLEVDACAATPSERPSCNVRFAVVAESPDTTFLAIRIRFCSTPACDALEDADPPVLGYVLTRPFFRGRVTRLLGDPAFPLTNYANVPDVQPPPGEEVGCDGSFPCALDRCRIAGCIQGMPTLPEGYCDREGRHYCE